ncbi:MAG: hypothetical protein WBH35_10105 [Bacillota bacterium]|jgi:hypothetical protein|nr:hypothetical protein [Bacillota bacterium]HOB91134.1 hypothetical protein [Bacillota bacterium]HPZ54260.1 hypothetical protein [Bacillota bacterium]HQD17543.1 hypothetical protein [Bacillota bacterium]
MDTVAIAVEWENEAPSGRIEVFNGECSDCSIVYGNGNCEDGRFSFSNTGRCRIQFTITNGRLAPGPNSTRVTVHNGPRTFTFFARDVNSDYPVWIAMYGVVVLPASDQRSYAEVVDVVKSRGLRSIQQRIEDEPEETYENACRHNRDEKCPTWLGLSRDMRFFEVGRNYTDLAFNGCSYVQPRWHSALPSIPETNDSVYRFNFSMGKGESCCPDVSRRLDQGYLPILHETQREDEISYHVTAFATLEASPLTAENLRGSEWEASYANTNGCMLTPQEREAIKHQIAQETVGREEETVLMVRIKAVNSGDMPNYAWFKIPACLTPNTVFPVAATYDPATGLSSFESGRVYAISLLDGQPAPAEEMAILIRPGDSAVLDIIIPHQPLPKPRAERLAKIDFDSKLQECREFWLSKLRSAASVSVPEGSIDERVKAGLLHCDIAAIGREPDGPVLATIGWYSPIGSESSPIIQFFDSMGWHSLAERCIDFFLRRQRDDGFIQNFGGYQLETGPVLWTMGEHFRYTRDVAWVERVKAHVLKACDYLLAWRERNKRPELRGRGYGLLDGKVADPEDFFHSFMLNALSYVGIKRAAEMLEEVDPEQSERLSREAQAFREDIRTAYYEAVGRSPVIPLGDGTWISTMPPWAEYPGPVALYAQGGRWFTHGAFGGRDSLIGALYLVIGEVLDANEIGAEIALRTNQQLFTLRNAGLSQPYYVRHDYIHLLRGEVKEFLKTYYNQFTALQDRETYTFWEHYYHASQHKTHEEGWFLMQTRWMLWLEQGDTLKLLSGIPRYWLTDGKSITLNQAASYFGPFDLQVDSHVEEGVIKAAIRLHDKGRLPSRIVIRLPHPEELRAVDVAGGAYDPATETVTVEPLNGEATIELRFR